MSNNNTQAAFEQEKLNIPKIFDYFALGKPKKIKLIGQVEGMSNHNYLVEAVSGEFIVKFPVAVSLESLENDLVIGEQLIKVGIKSPIYCKNSQSKFIYNRGISAVVSRRIIGTHPNTIDNSMAFIVGKALGTFHKAVNKVKNSTVGWLNPNLAAKLTEFESEPVLKKAREYLRKGSLIYQKKLPGGIIHGDFYISNLLLDIKEGNKILAIMDFEDSEKNILIVDIARSLLTVCANITDNKVDKNLVNYFLKGYSSVRPLLNRELNLIPQAILYVGGACIIWYIKNGYALSAKRTIERVNSYSQ